MYKKYSVWVDFFTPTTPEGKRETIQVVAVMVGRNKQDVSYDMQSLADTMVDVNEWDSYTITDITKMATLQVGFDDED